MNTIRTVIVDDERLARDNLRYLLRSHPEVIVVGEASGCAQARELLRTLDPDVLLLDIQLRGESGFELLRDLGDQPRVIFVTAHDEYAVRAFEVNVVDYLLKPVEPERLAKAIARIKGKGGSAPSLGLRYRYDDCVFLNTGRQTFLVAIANIAAVTGDGNYTHVQDVLGRDHMVRVTMSQWQERLPEDAFITLSRSLLVNRHHIAQWEVRGREADLLLTGIASPFHLGRAAVAHLRQAVRSIPHA